MLPKGRDIVAAFSVHLTVRPSHFCLEHISKSIEDGLMKLDTLIEDRLMKLDKLIEDHEGNCRMQEP